MMQSYAQIRYVALPLVVALTWVVTGCAASPVSSAPAASSKSPVVAASKVAETSASAAPSTPASTTPATSTCRSLAPEVVRIAGAGESDYPEIVGISGLKLVEDRQAKYKSGALKATSRDPQVVVLSLRGTAVWDDNSETGVQFQLAYDINGNRAVAYQRT